MKPNPSKTPRLYRGLLAALLLAAGTLPALAGPGPDDPGCPPCPEREFSRSLHREFTTMANGITTLYNKYGQVTVNTWPSNQVKIDVTITVNADDERKAEKVFNRINVNFASTAGFVKAETVLDLQTDWWDDLSGNSCPKSCQDFKINYEVWMPAANQLDLKNKYGNSYVGALTGKLSAEIKYGDLRTENLSGDAELFIDYGKVAINNARNISGQISNGSLTVNEAANVQLDTRYAECRFARAGAMRLTSRYDDFDFGQVEDLRIQSKYSTVRLQNARTVFVTAQYSNLEADGILEVADADLMNGSLKIAALSRNFSSVNVNGKNTNVQVKVERGAAYRFDAAGGNAGFDMPVKATMKRRTSGKESSVEGYVGDANARGLVKARLENGGLVLK